METYALNNHDEKDYRKYRTRIKLIYVEIYSSTYIRNYSRSLSPPEFIMLGMFERCVYEANQS